MFDRLLRVLRGLKGAQYNTAVSENDRSRSVSQAIATSDVHTAETVDIAAGARDQTSRLSTILSELASARGRRDAAAMGVLLEAGLRDFPDDPRLNCHAGHRWILLGDPEQALDFFRLALYYDPSSFDACDGVVTALRVLRRSAEVAEVLSKFLEDNPGHVNAAIALADHWYSRGAHDLVVKLLEPFARDEAVDRGIANLLGLVLGREFGEFERAETILRTALKKDPNWLPALTNLGWILLEQGRIEEGETYIEKALALSPGESETRLVRACMNLKQARFAEGWRDYDARLESRHAIKRPYEFPIWRGEPLTGKTILVFAEQGLGDQIMFASCVGELRNLAARVIIECNPKLVRLFQRSFPWAQVQESVSSGEQARWLGAAGTIDFQCAIGSLPGFFRSQWDDFPRHSGYLVPDRERVQYWRDKLSLGSRAKSMGLSWRGGSVVTRKHLRTIPILDFSALTTIDCEWVSLQYDEATNDIQSLREVAGLELFHWQSAIDDYDETAALVSALDGVLSVCTSIIHLAGALGKPVWILAPTITEWRYLDKGSRLPWYPSATMIRQRRTGDWRDAIQDSTTQINAHLATIGT